MRALQMNSCPFLSIKNALAIISLFFDHNYVEYCFSIRNICVFRNYWVWVRLRLVHTAKAEMLVHFWDVHQEPVARCPDRRFVHEAP